MQSNPKKKITKKYLFFLSLMLFLGIFFITFFIYFNYQKQQKKDFIQNTAQEFSQTIKTLNKASNIKGQIDMLDASNPKILESTQQQIKIIQDVLDNSKTQITKLEEMKQISSLGKIEVVKKETLVFYKRVESTYSKYLDCLQYFNDLNQIISQFQEIEEGVKNQNILKEVEEKLLLITPPTELQNFHQSLLSEYQNEAEGSDELENNNSVDYNQQIESLYKDFQENINATNDKSKQVKQLIIDQQILLKLKPLTIDIENWK
jgi:hypothetical protein